MGLVSHSNSHRDRLAIGCKYLEGDEGKGQARNQGMYEVLFTIEQCKG